MRRYIWARPTAELRWLWKPLIEFLARRIEAIPLLLVNSSQDRDFYKSQFDSDFAGEIIVMPDIYRMTVDGTQSFSDDEAVRILADFERRHDLLFYRDMLLPDRHLGRAFLSGADGTPSSRTSERATPRAIIAAGAMSAKFYDDLALSHPPAMILVMSGGTGLQGKPLAAIAKRLKIPFRNLMHTRFGFRYYWAEDEFGNSVWLNEKLKAEPMPSPEQISEALRELRPTGDFEFYVNLKRQRTKFLSMLKFLATTAIKHARYRVGRSRKVQIGYRMLSEMAMIVRNRRHRKLLLAHERPVIADLPSDRQLVFFPLQVEPEISLHGLAPLFIDQLHTVNLLCQHLPANALLIVKEHPAQIGRRSDVFYRKLMAYPNAVLLNELEHSYPLIHRADLIVAVTSSAAHEAAVMGQRVVYLSEAGPLKTVPHVRHLQTVHDFSSLHQLLQADGPEAKTARVLDGVRYYLGLKRHAVSFDYLGIALFDRNRKPSEDEIVRVATKLLETLQPAAALPANEVVQ
ncbi:MAG: hypothetical protein WCI56_00745 [Hyphomicrobiales bacterium]